MHQLFYDIHELTHIYKTKIPKTEELIKRLGDIGFNASATHFSPVSVKTNATIKDVAKVFRWIKNYLEKYLLLFP